MKSCFFISIILFYILGNAQDYFSLDAYNGKYNQLDDSTTIFKLINDTNVIVKFNRKTNYTRLLRFDTLIESGYRSLRCIDCSSRGKQWATYYANGKVESFGDYYKGEKIGDWKYYYSNGKLKRLERFFYDFDGISYYTVKTIMQSEYEYYENGQLKMEGQYAKSYDCIDSIYMVDPFTGNETLQIKPGPACSKKCGTWNYYFPDGSLMKREEY